MCKPKVFDIIGLEETEYFLTGSRALDNKEIGYIISSTISDYDYVVTIHRRHLIINYLLKNEIPINYSCYNGGFRFVEDEKIYNIITAIEMDFMAWRESLNILKHLINTNMTYRNAIADKRIRYSIYEQLRGLCKSVITFGEILSE